MSDYSLKPGYAAIPAEALPDGWTAKRLGEVIRASQGGKLGLTKETDYVANGVAAFSAAGQDGFVERAEFVNQSGVVLSAIGANCGRCFYAEGDWTTLANVQALIPNEELNARFLYYRANIENYWTRSGSAQPFIKPSSVKSSWIAFPTRAVQDKIAEILTTVDEALEQTEALVGKLEQMKAGLMHDLFTRGVTPDGHLRPTHQQAPHLYHETPLGWLPKEWEVNRLGAILKKCGGYLQTGPFGSQLHAHEYQQEGVPVVMPQDINEGLISTDQIARIFEQRAEELARHRMRVGDVVIARRGDLSRAAAINDFQEGWVCGTGCFLLRLGRGDLRADFASALYRYDFIQRQIEGMAVGTTMPSLNNTVMERLFFPFCDHDEQTRIIERLTANDAILISSQTHLAKLCQQRQGLMQDLLTGRVPVR